MMKLFFYILILCSFLFSNNNYDSLNIEKAFSAYKNSEYFKALNYFKKIEKDDYQSPELYYNIGNCNFKLNRFSDAILYYERALLYIPNHKNTLENLELAKQNLPNLITIEESFDSKIYKKIISFIPTQLLIKLIFYFLFLIVLLSFITINYRKKRNFLIILIFCLIFLNSIIVILHYKRIGYFFKPNKAMIDSNIVQLRSGPSEKLPVIFGLYKGEVIQIIKKDDEWSLIKTKNNQEGWAFNHHLTIITP